MNNCSCGRPSNGGFLCKRCTRILDITLGDLPALIEDLDLTISKQTATSSGEQQHTKSSSEPLPLNLAAADVSADLRRTLTRVIRRLDPAQFLTDWTEPRMVSWLQSHLQAVRLHKQATDMASAIHDIARRIHEIVDLPRWRKFMVGPCPEDGCQGNVWALLPLIDAIPPSMNCRTCKREWETIEWRRAGRRIAELKPEWEHRRGSVLIGTPGHCTACDEALLEKEPA